MSGLALPFLIDRFEIDKGVGGLIPATAALGFGVGSLIGGRVADTVGRKATVSAGLLLMSASSFGLALAPFYWIALGAAVAGGLGSGFIEAAANAAVADLAGPKTPRALSVLHFCFGAGAVLGPFAFAFLLAVAGRWWTAYLALGLSQLLLTLWAQYSALPGRAETSAHCSPTSRSLFAFRFNLEFFLLGVLMFLYVAVEFGFGQWEFAYLTQELDTSEAFASAAVSVFFASLAVGRLIVAWLTRYFRVPVILYALVIATIATGAVVPLAGASILPAAALGLACSGIFPLALALGSERAPGSAGQWEVWLPLAEWGRLSHHR